MLYRLLLNLCIMKGVCLEQSFFGSPHAIYLAIAKRKELYQVNLGVCSPENKSVFSHWESPPLQNNGLAFPRTISHWSSWQEGSNKTFHHYNVRGMFALKPNLVDWPFGSITMPLVCCSLPIAALC